MTYTLWLQEISSGKLLYQWANVFKTVDDAQEYKKNLEGGLTEGFRWVVIENEGFKTFIPSLDAE